MVKSLSTTLAMVGAKWSAVFDRGSGAVQVEGYGLIVFIEAGARALLRSAFPLVGHAAGRRTERAQSWAPLCRGIN